MNKALSSLPVDFRQIAAGGSVGFELSSRLIQPELQIHRSLSGLLIKLVGTKKVAGKKQTWEALSLTHNWIADDKLIRPLPHDTPEALKQMFGGEIPDELTLPDVIRLLRVEHPLIPVVADQSVFLSGQASASDLSPRLDVPGLNAKLFPYQAQGVSWMHRVADQTGGLLLADEMGLGKTIQIIALLLLGKPDETKPALIICPTSLIANWRQEILKFAPEFSVMIHRGHSRTGVTSGLQRAQIVLSTYDTVVKDISIFAGMTWSWLICDEAQALKNPDATRRKAVAGIPRSKTIPMTGTPVETSLRDLWSLADLAIPGLFGSQQDFETEYPDSEESARAVAQMTDPVVLCRKVADVADDLPDRIDIDIPLELGPDLTGRYEDVLAETIEKYTIAGNLVATGQLQLFCAHPWLQGSDASDENAKADPSASMLLLTPKIERTLSILEEAFGRGRKVLIFAIFNRCGDIIREAASGRLPDAFWGAINGSTPQEERQKIVDAFTKHDGPACLVLNPKAAGAGLNITAATVVIHFTQAWNPALEAQASARAHRRGQTEPVQIYRLFYENTVERIMIDRSEWRRELANEAVPVSTRDADDIKRALTIRPGGEADVQTNL